MPSQINILWFRQDLRLSDNPALNHAASLGKVLPIYILDTTNPGPWAMGGASKWWLYYSLHSLNQSLDGKLQVFSGDPLTIIPKLCEEHNIASVNWNRCYEPWRINRDAELKQQLIDNNITCHSFNGSLLWEPFTVSKPDGTPYKVFTPYYRRGCLNKPNPKEPEATPNNIEYSNTKASTQKIADLALLDTIDWAKQLEPHWHIGEQGAQQALSKFLQNGMANYKQGRDFPSLQSISRLSPHLHYGEISPHQVWASINTVETSDNSEHFRSELAWREFSYYQLYHFPQLPSDNFQAKFSHFPWQHNPALLKQWQQGQTGYPLVDAGMRELWQTGYMHNRVRMVVASFLVKNLLIHWHHGRDWFWDCLVDADLASNSASWQWVAGCGADAAPYFRIFNPTTQGEKFDKHGEYTRRWIPELANMPDKYLYKPSEAPNDVLNEAGVVLGETYPHPMVSIKASREQALAAYQQLKEQYIREQHAQEQQQAN